MSLRCIATELGISVTTVSRALGGFDDVAADTRARVLAEAERIGYRPNAAARRLRGGRTDAVGIVLPTGPGRLDDPFFLGLIGAVGPILAQAGLDLIVGAAASGKAEEAFYRQLVENRRVDGILLARTRRRDRRLGYLLDRGFPVVVHGRAEERRPHARVDVDGTSAFRRATERLVTAGHRRIGLLSAPARYSFAHHRETGWRQALADAGLAPGPMLQAEATEENGFRTARAMLAGKNPPTALLCATDRIAVGALHAISHGGMQAGRDVAVIGYDNLPVATYTDPPLTTFDTDLELAARRMVEMMLALLGGARPDRARRAARGNADPARLRRASSGKSQEHARHQQAEREECGPC